MDVKYDVFLEDVYFDKVTAALSSGSIEYDAFMTGAYKTWTYGPAGWITDLKEWINDRREQCLLDQKPCITRNAFIRSAAISGISSTLALSAKRKMSA
jgi:hypothetical protein